MDRFPLSRISIVAVVSLWEKSRKVSLCIPLGLQFFTELVGLLERLRVHDLTFLIDAGAVNSTLHLGTGQTVGKAPHGVYGALHGTPARSGGGDEVDLLIPDLRVPWQSAVDEGLELTVHGIEIYRRGQNQHISLHHLVENLGHIVLLHADAVVLVATSPKSNSAYDAINAAIADVQAGRTGPIPRQLQNKHYDGEDALVKGQNYKYAHDYDHHWVAQQYLPDAIKDVKYYTFGDNKNEQAARAYWAKIKGEENV